MTRYARRGLAWATLLALLGLVEWPLIDVPELETAMPPPKASWTIPQSVPSQPERALAILGRTAPWGKLPDPGRSAAPLWRFLGVVRVGGDRTVLIQVTGQPVRELRAGDELPGGTRISSVDDDAFTVLLNGKRRRIEVQQQEQHNL